MYFWGRNIMLKNILIAFDGSVQSHNAVEFAAGVSQVIPGAKCTLITVLAFTRDEARFLGASQTESEQAEKEFADKYFRDIKKVFANSSIPLTIIIREGDPAKEILKYAGENGIDHIVIGPRGLGNIQGALLGSVSSKIIHLARCPVTLVKNS